MKKHAKFRQSKDWWSSYQILTGKEILRINDGARKNFIDLQEIYIDITEGALQKDY
jgi:hypothetical protein